MWLSHHAAVRDSLVGRVEPDWVCTPTSPNMNYRKVLARLKPRLKGLPEREEKEEMGKEKLKRPPPGTRDKGEGFGMPGDLEIGPSGAPACVPLHGQESNATRETFH